ncbi:unnamed protein product [Symbiodinium natans]|uniref:Uncharacterized protein n=1 Tax=Symbiodinium natans TaxID=878477 RepID=A0A812PR28_9DINO|nr:unnamed protein product [Symbiodinium natans]
MECARRSMAMLRLSDFEDSPLVKPLDILSPKLVILSMLSTCKGRFQGRIFQLLCGFFLQASLLTFAAADPVAARGASCKVDNKPVDAAQDAAQIAVDETQLLQQFHAKGVLNASSSLKSSAELASGGNMKLATSPKIGIMYTLSCGTCGQNVCDGPFVEEAASFSDDYELGDTMSSDPSTDCNKFPDNPRLIRQCPGMADCGERGAQVRLLCFRNFGVLHHLAAWTQCGRSFSELPFSENRKGIECDYEIGSDLATWGCDKLPQSPRLIHDSGTGKVYVAETGCQGISGILHHVTTCHECGWGNFCRLELFSENRADLACDYEVGVNLTTWGCDKLSQNPKVVHDSKTGAIYVVEEPVAMCAYDTLADGSSPDVRTDEFHYIFSTTGSTSLTWPVECSKEDGLAFGKCHKPAGSQHAYCLRKGISSKVPGAHDWGYCRPCPPEVFTPKCAYVSEVDGSRPFPRKDNWRSWTVPPTGEILWMLSAYGQSCTEACRLKSGSWTCSEHDLRQVSTEAQARASVRAAGHECTRMIFYRLAPLAFATDGSESACSYGAAMDNPSSACDRNYVGSSIKSQNVCPCVSQVPWPNLCSTVHKSGQCAVETLPQEQKKYDHSYCLRPGVTERRDNQHDWGYCRDCPEWFLAQTDLAAMYGETGGVKDYMSTPSQAEGGTCWGPQECRNGLRCIGRTCRQAPMSSWGVRKRVDKDCTGSICAKYNDYLKNMEDYQKQIVRNQKRMIIEYQRLTAEEKRIKHKEGLMVAYVTANQRLKLVEDLHRAQASKLPADDPRRRNHEQIANDLRTRRTPLEQQAGRLDRELRHHRTMVGIHRRVLDNQAKQNAAKHRALMEKLHNDGVNRWPESTTTPGGEARNDPNYPQRTKNPKDFKWDKAPSDTDIRKVQETLDQMADSDLKDRAKKKKRGAMIGYQQQDTARWASLMSEDGRGMLTLEGSYQYQLGACPEGLCVEVGGAITVAYEHEVYNSEGVSITVRVEAEVYADAGASVGCGAEVQGCQVTVSAAVGAKTGASTRVKQDLGHGVTADYTAAVEAGYIAKAEAEAGCTSKKGCTAKAKAFAGAYAKANADSQVGNEHVSGKVGGSVMAGIAAGASGDVSGVYSDGKLTLGGSACAAALVGVCADVQFEVDLSGGEDLAQDLGDFWTDVASSDDTREALQATSEGLGETLDSGAAAASGMASGATTEWENLKRGVGGLFLLQDVNSTTAEIFDELDRLTVRCPVPLDPKPVTSDFGSLEEAEGMTKRLLQVAVPRLSESETNSNQEWARNTRPSLGRISDNIESWFKQAFPELPNIPDIIDDIAPIPIPNVPIPIPNVPIPIPNVPIPVPIPIPGFR